MKQFRKTFLLEFIKEVNLFSVNKDFVYSKISLLGVQPPHYLYRGNFNDEQYEKRFKEKYGLLIPKVLESNNGNKIKNLVEKIS